MISTSRRGFVRDGSIWFASAALWGCRTEPATATATGGAGVSARSVPPPVASPTVPTVGSSASAPMVPPTSAHCDVTPDNIEGPYYRDGAPMRADLTHARTPGTRLLVRGRVTGPGCEPVSRALLDVWQADHAGRYDNDGRSGDEMVLRGKLVTADDGTFELRSIVPGRYLNGAQYRPAHVHFKVSAAGFAPLITQLYFEGDEYNSIDPFIKSPLIMRVADEAGRKAARFDFALSRA